MSDNTNNKNDSKMVQNSKDTSKEAPFESPRSQESSTIENTKKDTKLGMKKSTKSAKTAENVVVQVILWMTTLGLFWSCISLVWAIGDLFSETKFEDFLAISLQSQLFIVGIILMGIFFLVLFLVVFYRRGRRNLHKSLFKEIPKEEISQEETYQIAKYIAAGALIAVFLVFTGLIIALIEFLFGNFFNENTPDFFKNLTGGTISLIVGFIVLLFDGLVYSMVYIWQNGHRWVIHSILLYNEKAEFKHVFTKNQQLTGKILFALIVAELIGVVFGVVWAIIESFTGDWGSSFRLYPVGIQISFYGVFGALFFGTMVFSMFFYKRGNNLIMTSLFVQYQPKETEKDNFAAKVITVGILVAITLIVVGLLIWLVSLIIQAFSSGGGTNLFTFLSSLSSGLALLAYSTLFGIFTILGLLFSYFLHNGYFFTLEKILTLESKIDSSLDEGITKGEEKREQRKKKKKDKKKSK